MFDWLASTTPDFWTAILTLGLLIVAVVAAWIGLGTLRAAAASLQLESTPYLVVTLGKSGDETASTLEYVLAEPETGTAPRLRPRAFEIDEPTPGHGVTISPHYGGRRNWPRGVITAKNVGRSPAVAVRIDATFRFSNSQDANYAALSRNPQEASPNPAPWLPGRDYPLRPVGSGGFGTIEVASIMPGENVHIVVENRYAASAAVKIAHAASAASVDRRIGIPILSPPKDLLIQFHP